MKNNCLTGKVSLKPRNQLNEYLETEENVFGKSLDKRSIEGRRRNYSNPFDCMIFKGKAYPLLPPVINKHRKNPSIPVMRYKEIGFSDRPGTRSLRPVKSDFALPKICRPSVLPDTQADDFSKQEPSLNSNLLALKNLKTPNFNGSLQQLSEGKRNCPSFFAIRHMNESKNPGHKHKVSQLSNLSEISFGLVHDDENSIPCFKIS